MGKPRLLSIQSQNIISCIVRNYLLSKKFISIWDYLANIQKQELKSRARNKAQSFQVLMEVESTGGQHLQL